MRRGAMVPRLRFGSKLHITAATWLSPLTVAAGTVTASADFLVEEELRLGKATKELCSLWCRQHHGVCERQHKRERERGAPAEETRHVPRKEVEDGWFEEDSFTEGPF